MAVERKDQVWKSQALVETYLEGIRKALPFAGEQIDVMVRLLAAGKAPVESFLDLGCGDGILSAAVLARFPQARGVLLDFSQPMIESAQTKLARLNDRVFFKTVDYGEDGWVDHVRGMAPFDAVVSGYSIHHQPDERKRQLYAQIHDLLKPGGMFINIEHVLSPTDWLEEAWADYFIDALYARSKDEKNGKTRDQVAQEFYYRPDKEANILAPVDVQCEWLREIGYQDVDCYLKVFELAVFGGRRAPL